MFDAVMNVGIKDGKIILITKDKIKGSETIDAAGHVVTAGFIDTHFHSLDMLAVKFGLRDGVTTGMDLEYGAWLIDEWYAAKKANWPMNYGTTVSQEIVRMVVHDGLEVDAPVDASWALSSGRGWTAEDGVEGWSVTKSSLEEMNRISSLIDEGLRQGALGLGSTVGYMGKGVTSYEMFEAQRAAARYGRLSDVHTRFSANADTPTEAPLAFDEVFANAVVLKAPLILAHDNNFGWWENEEKMQLARAMGMNVWGEYYPYTAGSTTIGSEMLRPEIWEDNMGNKYEETVYDPSADKFLTKEEYLEVAKSDPGRAVVGFIPAREDWLKHWLKMPHMTVAGDGMPALAGEGKLFGWDDSFTDYKGHPRTAGSHGKVLRLAREAGVPLMHTLAQLSYWSAKHLGDAGIEAMKDRGRMQIGKVADIVVFDPKTVQDNATYKNGEHGLPSTGIPYVMVNGKIVVRKSKAQKVMAGQPIRYPVESKGRFVPADVQRWISTYSINVDNSGLAK